MKSTLRGNSSIFPTNNTYNNLPRMQLNREVS